MELFSAFKAAGESLGICKVDEMALMQDMTYRMSSARCFVAEAGKAVMCASEQKIPMLAKRVIFVEVLTDDGDNSYRLLEDFGAWADSRKASKASIWTPWFGVDEERVAALGWEPHGNLLIRRSV